MLIASVVCELSSVWADIGWSAWRTYVFDHALLGHDWACGLTGAPIAHQAREGHGAWYVHFELSIVSWLIVC